MVINCASCGANTNPSQKFCEYCGTQIVMPEPEVNTNAGNDIATGSFDSLFGSINKIMSDQGLNTIDFGNMNNSSQTITTTTTIVNGQPVSDLSPEQQAEVNKAFANFGNLFNKENN